MISNLKAVGQGSLSSTVQQFFVPKHPIIVNDSVVQCVNGNHYIMTNSTTPFTAMLSASPQQNDTIMITNSTGRFDGTIERNGNKISGLSENIIFDIMSTLQLKYINSTIGWIAIN